jgi:hypothetical protein
MISMSYAFEACSCPVNVQKLNGPQEDEAELPCFDALKAVEPISVYQDEESVVIVRHQPRLNRGSHR